MNYLATEDLNNWQNLEASNLVFIDTSLTDYNSLIPKTHDTAVVYLDSQQNGIEQITEALEKYSNLDSVSIFSHGDEGYLQLGSTNLSASNLDEYQADLVAWGNALSENGDLLFYGCNVAVGLEGFDFVERVAHFTGADVAASDDLTGNFDLGGDWTLEVAIGIVETQTFTLTEYGGLLAISQYNRLNGITADFNGDGKADILRQEKGNWAEDTYNTANLLISTGTGFNKIVLPEDLWITGDLTNLYVGDFNGDGKSDLLRQEKGYWDNNTENTANLLISTGTGFNKIVLPENLWIGGDWNNLYVGDFNGDGKSDLLRQRKGGGDDVNDWGTAMLLTSTGTGFTQTWLSPDFWMQGDLTNLYVGDFNGDGKSDILRQEKGVADDVNDWGTAVLLTSTGNNFTQTWLSPDFWLGGDNTNLYVGDFNGDGKSDVFVQEKSFWDNDNDWSNGRLLISTGTNFTQYWMPPELSVQGDVTNLYVGDFNGDGKSDLLRQEKGAWDNNNENTANLLISTGTGFNKIVLAESFNLGGDYTNLYTGDFTGDGKSDLIRQEKGWYNYNDKYTGQLLTSTGSNFSTTNLDSTFMLNGNYTNLISNNFITKYLADNEQDGLKFNFTYDTNVTLEQKIAFELAGQMWSDSLMDDVTVNIHVSMVNNTDLPSNTLGGAVPFFYQGTSYTNFKTQLSQEIDPKQAQARNNYDDQTAVNNLDTGSTVQVASPNNTNGGIWRNFDQVAMTRANAKALGFIEGDDKTLDSTIVMNNLIGTGVSWQYNYFSNGVGASQIDFTTVAMHEIGHTLGFVSLVDGLTNSNYGNQTLLNSSITALDLFRYMSGGTRSIRTVGSYFSLDKGVTNLARNAQGVANIGGDYTADGYQGSHWKNEDNAGIMDPLLEMNVRRLIGEFDLRALDVIGWDRKFAPNPWGVLDVEAWNSAENIGNINRNTDVNSMLQDWRWARGSSTSTLRQDGNIAQFLAQQGFFSIGSFRESFDFDAVQLSTTFLEDFLVTIERAESEELLENLDLDTLGAILEEHIEVNENNEVTNYNELLTSLTQWLSNYESGELTLADFQQFLDNQELVSSVVKDI